MLSIWVFTNVNSFICFINVIYIQSQIFSLVAPTPLGLIGRSFSPKAFFPLRSWLSKNLRVYPVQKHHQFSFKYRAGKRGISLALPSRTFPPHGVAAEPGSCAAPGLHALETTQAQMALLGPQGHHCFDDVHSRA